MTSLPVPEASASHDDVPSWAVVATVSEPAALLTAFAAHHRPDEVDAASDRFGCTPRRIRINRRGGRTRFVASPGR